MSVLVLIVEDEALLGRNMRVFLERQGYQANHALTVKQALESYRANPPDIVLVDHNLPDGDGLSLVSHIRDQDRWTKIVMITAHGGVEVAVAAMKAGADDYLTKPVSLEEVSLLCGKLVEQARMQGSLAYFQSRDEQGLGALIGNSAAMVEVKRRIRKLTQAERVGSPDGAEAGPPVMILGETGVGKELVARALHFEGPRAGQPFVAVNCAALPEQLVESELFGHERGAFTGANEKRIGLFQAAEGGTLFLDEVGELPAAQQAKLLRAIEDRAIRPVGGVRDRKINVRFVAATNAAIEERARHGEFRADLLYRLNAITLDVPSLRDREGDVALIAQSLLADAMKRYGRRDMHFSDEALTEMKRYEWPGNIRELRNVVEQACLMSARSQISASDLNLRRESRAQRAAEEAPRGSPPAGTGLTDAEIALIVAALRRNSGNVTLAARELGVSRDTLRYRMEKFGLKRESYQ